MDQYSKTFGMLLLAVGGYMVVTWIKSMGELKEEGRWDEVKVRSFSALILWLVLIVLGLYMI